MKCRVREVIINRTLKTSPILDNFWRNILLYLNIHKETLVFLFVGFHKEKFCLSVGYLQRNFAYVLN